MTPLRPGTFSQVPGKHYGTPKEIWGFRAPRATGPPERIARAFLQANVGLLGIDQPERLLERRKIIESLGARHVIFQQGHQGMRIHRAYVTVHLDLAGRIYLVKNRAVPRELLPGRPQFRISELGAR